MWISASLLGLQRSIVVILSTLAYGASVYAQSPFPIVGYQVQGNTLLSPESINAATRPHTSPQGNFETIQLALESLEKAYINAGYGSVRVEIPEQELESGVVTLQVIEGVLGLITVEPDPYFNADNVRHSLPALRPGETVNVFELNRNLFLANEGGSKVSNVTFKHSANNRDVDATVKLSAEDPQRWMALLDNTGSASTGLYRLGVVYQNANLFNRDHGLSVQLMTSPDHTRDVSIMGLGYRVPLYRLGDTLDFNASSSNVDSGQVAQAGGGPDLAISGSGLMLGARYTHNLDATATAQHAFSIGLEHRAYGNRVMPTGGSASLIPDLTTHPLTLGYSGSWHSPTRDFSVNLSWLQNLAGGENGTTADFNQPGGRSGANASFQTFKFTLQHTERFTSQWMLRTALSGQSTQDLLIAAEQFGIGGADSVRGFGEREISGDQGVRAALEVWAPPVSWEPWRLIPLVFLDGASVWRNQAAPGEQSGQTISSVGLGLRAAYGHHLNARLDWGYVIKGVSGIAGPVNGDQHLHASLAWVF